MIGHNRPAHRDGRPLRIAAGTLRAGRSSSARPPAVDHGALPGEVRPSRSGLEDREGGPHPGGSRERSVSSFTARNMRSQGFGYLGPEAASRYAWPLRFTPAVATPLIVTGLVRQSPIWLASMALVALSGALFPRGMVIDLVYNLGVRRLSGSPPLPPTPQPRRFSYALSAALLAVSALSFAGGLPVVGFVLGGAVAVGAAILTTTLWCLGSWVYRIVAAVRKWTSAGRRRRASGRDVGATGFR